MKVGTVGTDGAVGAARSTLPDIVENMHALVNQHDFMTTTCYTLLKPFCLYPGHLTHARTSAWLCRRRRCAGHLWAVSTTSDNCTPATTRKEGSAPARCSGTSGCGAARLMSSCSGAPPRSTSTLARSPTNFWDMRYPKAMRSPDLRSAKGSWIKGARHPVGITADKPLMETCFPKLLEGHLRYAAGGMCKAIWTAAMYTNPQSGWLSILWNPQVCSVEPEPEI
jgi:hypothetical protein